MSGNRFTSVGQRTQQHGHALAGFVEAAEEQHRLARAAGSRRAAAPIANDATSTPLGISTASLPSASICQRRARSDTAMRPTIFSCIGRRMGSKHAERQRLRGRGVERRDDRAFGDLQRQHRQARRVGLVQVQHVEVTVGAASFLTMRWVAGPEPQPGHRPVVRNRHRLAAGHHVVGQLHVRRRRRQHADVMAAAVHHLGQLQHVGLHAAGHVERVRADHADAHQLVSSLRAPLVGEVGQPLRLHHVPVGGMGGDVAGEPVGQRLGDGGDVARRRVQRRRRRRVPAVARVPAVRGQQRGAGLDGQLRRTRRASGSARRRSRPARPRGSGRGRPSGTPARCRAAVRRAPRTAAARRRSAAASRSPGSPGRR